MEELKLKKEKAIRKFKRDCIKASKSIFKECGIIVKSSTIMEFAKIMYDKELETGVDTVPETIYLLSRHINRIRNNQN